MAPTRCLLALACALVPASADAQWAFSTYTGGNHTRPSSAAGATAQLTSMLSAMVGYKFTYARPEIDLTAGGRGQLTAASHHIAVGLTIGR